MHLVDYSKRFMGGYGIVGGHLPLAVGGAWAAKYRKQDDVIFCMFGDGATNIGAFHEALNLASVWRLPVVFVCENNLYMEYTPIGDVTAVEHPAADRASAYGLESILVDGKRLTIVLSPIKGREHIIDYVKDALNRIRNMGVRVRYLLFDGGFSSLELPAYLEENGYVYAIRFTPNAVTKRIGLQDGESASYPCDRPFKLVRVDDKKEPKIINYLFATNMTCRPKRLLKRYKTRWGVETSYREHNHFLPRTKSKNFTVRLLYYAVAVCIYNVWCILNALEDDRSEENDGNNRRVTALEVKIFVLLAFLIPGAT